MNLQELIWLFLVGHTSFARKMVMKCYGELHKIVWKNLTMWVVVHHLAGLASSENLFSSVQSLNCVRLFVTPWTAARQASLSITNSWSLLKLMCIESVMPYNHLILCHPLLLLPSIFPSIRVFSNELGFHMRWPKYWSFSFSISLSNGYSGLISYRIDWFDLLAVQGTLKTLLYWTTVQKHSAFFIVQLSHPYMTMTTGKTIALTAAAAAKSL